MTHRLHTEYKEEAQVNQKTRGGEHTRKTGVDGEKKTTLDKNRKRIWEQVMEEEGDDGERDRGGERDRRSDGLEKV